MLLSLVYFAVRRLLRLLTRSGEGDTVAREIEILVLRHQLHVLFREVDACRCSVATASYWRRPAGCWGGVAGARSRSQLRHCCAGIASWCDESGLTDASGQRAGRG